MADNGAVAGGNGTDEGFSAEAMPGSDADSAQDALDRAFAEKIGCAPVLPL
jgi:hypothetical protein